MTKIKRINSIQNLGVYNDYRRSGNIQDFNDKNIIYGWNYCGKTTLSRLLNWLNPTSAIDEDFSAATFEIELDDDTKLTVRNRAVASQCIVQVFNSDFVSANLQFVTTNNKIRPITFELGEETKPIRAKITLLNKRIENYNIITGATTYYTQKYNGFEGLFTNRARIIKNDFFNSAIEFTKTHLKQIIAQLSWDTYKSYIIVDPTELAECQSNALERDAKPMIDATCPILQFATLLEETKRILALSPHDTVKDDILSNDQGLYDWAETGLQLHKTKSLVKCAFCGQTLTSERIKYLNEFYSNEAAKVKEAAKLLIQQIGKEKQLEKMSAWLTLSEYSFTGDYGNQYRKIKSEYEAIANGYVSILDELIRIVQDKIDNKLFVPIELPEINIDYKEKLEDWVSKMEAIIKAHNESVRNFSQLKNNAINRYKKHLVASFLDEIDYYTILKGFENEEKFHQIITDNINIISQQIQQLEGQVKSIAKGKEVCNQYIKLLLHRDDIKIEITEDGYFSLKRNNKVARNLSEGEKSAIAFAYFLVLLESDIEKLKQSIIVIDDPISSLDADHIALVSSLINNFFFRKIDSDNQNKIVNCFAQLFILTHNFEFYNFIHDATNIKRKKKIKDPEGKTIEIPALNEYLIKRITKTESTIIDIPKSLSSYKSEYVYLWKQIYDYKQKGYPEDLNYIMPNIVRRFLEIYTLIKLPGNHDEIDNRVKILVNDVNELKILHNFSHFTSLERVVKHSELTMRMPDIIDDIFTLVQKDEVHFNSLNEGIKNG